MEIERQTRLLRELTGFGATLALFSIAFANLSFPDSRQGFEVKNDLDLAKLSPTEAKLAQKLLSLGLNISHEKRQIRLDQGVKTGRKNKSTGEFKPKNTTAPDFYFHFDGIDCFLEVGSHKTNAHKKRQEAVAREAVSFKGGRKILYVQLFSADIDQICKQVLTAEELISYLYAHSGAIFYSHNLFPVPV